MQIDIDDIFIAEVRKLFKNFGFENVTDEELTICINQALQSMSGALLTGALRQLRSSPP